MKTPLLLHFNQELNVAGVMNAQIRPGINCGKQRLFLNIAFDVWICFYISNKNSATTVD